MSDSYILHDVMRKVKADGLFDSIRRDLIADIEQKPSYIDLKSQIESLMSSHLSEQKWSAGLKKSDLREKARRHIETSNLIKDTLPSLVSQYMQTCQQQLVQPRLSSFVSDHIEHVYNAVGGTHIYRPSTTYTQPTPTVQETANPEKATSQSTIPVKKEPTISKPKMATNKTPLTSTIVKKKVPPSPSPTSIPQKKKPLPTPINPVKEEKKSRISSPLHSPSELIDISPSPPSIENEPTAISLSPSPPPPVVRIAPPLANAETPRKKKHDQRDSSMNIKKKKMKTDEEKSEVVVLSSSNETDSRRLRARRPNPKYSKEQFETDDLSILEPSSPPTVSKTKKMRPFKPSTSLEQEHLDTPSSPPALPTPTPIDTSLSVGNISPEYGTTLPSPTVEQQIDVLDDRSRTPSPGVSDTKKNTSPRRLRPRRANERSTVTENTNEKLSDQPSRTSTKTRESNRHRTDPSPTSTIPIVSDETDPSQTTTKRTRQTSSGDDNNSNELPSRSVSVPDHLNTSADETPISSPPVSTSVSKSFIWKPKISK